MEPRFEFSPYQETSDVAVGIKFFDTSDDKYFLPLSLKVLDTPGLIKKRAAQIVYSFQKPSMVLLVFDMSKKLYKQDIVEWNKFTLEKLQLHHPAFNLKEIMDEKNKEKVTDRPGLFSCFNMQQ